MDYKKKVCLVASSGGHYEQILMLKELADYFDVYYVTEKTKYSTRKADTYYVRQVNRQDKLICINLIIIFFQSLRIIFKEKPDVIISTGALSSIPTFVIGKALGKKLIFIESFAKISTPTLTGRFAYKIADKFIVQWQDMLKVYPNAEYFGSIY